MKMSTSSNGKKKDRKFVELELTSNTNEPTDIGQTPDSEKNVRFNRDDNEGDGTTSSRSNKGRISRGVSIQRGISTLTRKTMGFISINEDLTPEQRLIKQEKRKLLRQQHLDKFSRRPTLFSTSAGKAQDVTDGPRVAENLADVVLMAQAQTYSQTLPRKRENAAKVLWKAASRSLSTRPRADAFDGSSYLQSDLVGDEGSSSVFSSLSNLDTADGMGTPTSLTITPLQTPTLLFNEKFFDFNDEPTIRDEQTHLDVPDGGRSPYLTPTIEECPPIAEASSSAYDQIVPTTQWDWKELGKAPEIRAPRPGEVISPAYYRSTSRGARGLGIIPELKKRKKKYNREYGKGRIGDFLNRTLDRQRITSGIERQFEEFSNHRPYFTYWLSFVQVAIMIVMLALYPLAPIGVRQDDKEEKVLISRSGVIMTEQLKTKTPSSFWIGPSIETLIKLGAKYAPCMRKDKKIFKELYKERLAENKTGCCTQVRNTGCLQRSYEKCSSSSTKFHERRVCGQDPDFCKFSGIPPPAKWDKTTITKWPICRTKRDREKKVDYPWMSCDITGRPCCVKNQGQCIITTRNNCDFHHGLYHSEATLCSQVDCLDSTCGMLGFTIPDEPNQFYRLFLSLFLNAGILHVLLVLVFNFTVLRDIEVMAGWLRTSLIFILSGMGGNLWSAILIPYEPEVGELGASFGILSCLFVEVIQGWSLLKNPCVALGKLCAIMLVLIFLGLLPYIDNFAHIFGFIYGFFLSLILLPYVVIDKWDERRKQIQTVISIGVVVALTIAGFVLFYNNYDVNGGDEEKASSIIQYLNCVPIVENFCSNFHLGSKLESRNIVY